MIQETGLKPGDRLKGEAALAAEFSVSRGTVRESVRALAQIGVLSVSNGRRPEIAAIDGSNLAPLIDYAVGTDQATVLQSWELRRTLEARIAHLASLRRDENHIAEMHRIIEIMRGAIDDFERLSDLDIELHQCWASASGNPLFLLVIESLELIMRGTCPKGYAAMCGRGDVIEHIELHARISEAIIDQDPGLSVKLMVEHFDKARDHMIDAGFD